MPGAPIGATVTLTYDLVHSPDWPDPDEGDWLVSYSERTETWGTAYLIIGARRVRSEINPRRFSLRCTKIGAAAGAGIGEADRVYPIVWYQRDRRRPR
jgi:hypothetical protein